MTPLFVEQGRNKPGERLGYRGLYNFVRDLGELAGVKDLTPNRLRQTFVTNLLLLRIDAYMLALLQGTSLSLASNAMRSGLEQQRQSGLIIRVIEIGAG